MRRTRGARAADRRLLGRAAHRRPADDAAGHAVASRLSSAAPTSSHRRPQRGPVAARPRRRTHRGDGRRQRARRVVVGHALHRRAVARLRARRVPAADRPRRDRAARRPPGADRRLVARHPVRAVQRRRRATACTGSPPPGWPRRASRGSTTALVSGVAAGQGLAGPLVEHVGWRAAALACCGSWRRSARCCWSRGVAPSPRRGLCESRVATAPAGSSVSAGMPIAAVRATSRSVWFCGPDRHGHARFAPSGQETSHDRFRHHPAAHRRHEPRACRPVGCRHHRPRSSAWCSPSAAPIGRGIGSRRHYY